MPKAILELRQKHVFADGCIMEIVIWRLPVQDLERPHGFKYSLFYGCEGRRLIGYDNERGKGDHRHVGDREEAYEFSSLEKLLSDFERDVTRARRQT